MPKYFYERPKQSCCRCHYHITFNSINKVNSNHKNFSFNGNSGLYSICTSKKTVWRFRWQNLKIFIL